MIYTFTSTGKHIRNTFHINDPQNYIKERKKYIKSQIDEFETRRWEEETCSALASILKNWRMIGVRLPESNRGEKGRK